MRVTIFAVILLMAAATASAALYDQDQINALFDREVSGLRAYESGDFETAFSILSKTAPKGLKDSQYVIALMFMKGEGVNKSMLVGLGWLGVAIESGNEEWLAQWNKLYGALNDAQRKMVDDQVRRYKEKYGAEVQGISCDERTSAGRRRVELFCNKMTGAYPDYEIELVP